MRIDHAAIYVNDLEGAKAFFVKYFEAVPGSMYHNPKTDFRSYFLSFSDGSRLEIMNRPNLTAGNESETRLGFIHLAFSVGSPARVDALTQELRSAGFAVLSWLRVTGDGYYESCVQAFEGNLLEITV